MGEVIILAVTTDIMIKLVKGSFEVEEGHLTMQVMPKRFGQFVTVDLLSRSFPRFPLLDG
jgi:hypothetical protein